HEADPRWHDWGHHVCARLLERRRDLGDRETGSVDRYGVAVAELELLHLAGWRSHRGATRAQPGCYQLGHECASDTRDRNGWPPGSAQQELRPYLRPFRGRV